MRACPALHHGHLCGCGGRGGTCHCGADVAWAGRAPSRATGIRDAPAGPAPAGALPCPIKPRTRARVLTNADLRKAGIGALVWKEKAISLRWSSSESPRRERHRPLADLGSALTLCGMGSQGASCDYRSSPRWGRATTPTLTPQSRICYGTRRFLWCPRATRTRVADYRSSSA